MDDRDREFLEDFDDLSANVRSAKHESFVFALQRWFAALDAFPPAKAVVDSAEASIDFDEWFASATPALGSVGSGVISWPINSVDLMGAQLGLYRAFASGKQDVADFSMEFMYSDNNFDRMITTVNGQIFGPLTTELRKAIVRRLNDPRSELERLSVPASDRLVSLNHDAPERAELLAAIDRVEQAVREANDYPDEVDRRQRISELRAGKSLFSADRVRADAVGATLGVALLWLMRQFPGLAVGIASNAAWTYLQRLF